MSPHHLQGQLGQDTVLHRKKYINNLSLHILGTIEKFIHYLRLHTGGTGKNAVELTSICVHVAVALPTSSKPMLQL